MEPSISLAISKIVYPIHFCNPVTKSNPNVSSKNRNAMANHGNKEDHYDVPR